MSQEYVQCNVELGLITLAFCLFVFFFKVVQFSLSSIIPYVSGPKRSQDRVAVNNMKSDFQACLNEKVCTTDVPSKGTSCDSVDLHE